MSKSLGNGIDPLEVIDEFGADALRFTLVTGNSPGNDTRFSEDRVRASRNFANKLWNATRFVLMNLEDGKTYDYDKNDLELEDKWILSKLNKAKMQIQKNLENFEIGLAAGEIYEFIWFVFCDWYVEFVKPRLYGEEESRKNVALGVLSQVLTESISLLHPFMPFITEEIWQTLPGVEGKIIHADFPTAKDEDTHADAEEAIDLAIEAVTAIRNERQSRDIAPSKKSPVIFYAEKEEVRGLLDQISYEFKNLASASEVEVLEEEPHLDNAATIVLEQMKIYLPLDGLIDYGAELDKLTKELENAKQEVDRAEKKLANKGFTDKAPAAVVQKEEEKLEANKKLMAEVEQTIEEVRRKMEG